MTDLAKPTPEPNPAPSTTQAGRTTIGIISQLHAVLAAVDASAVGADLATTMTEDLLARMVRLGVRDKAAELTDFKDRIDMLSIHIEAGKNLVNELMARARHIRTGT